MNTYPLLFTFLDRVEGNGYLATVGVHGRLLATQEDDGAWWLYGVNPGGVAATGKTCAEAYIEFRKALMQVLFDLAAKSPKDFFAFRKAAKKFFDEENEPTRKEWEEAREQVRAGNITLEGVRSEKSEPPRRIDIKHTQTFAARKNATEPAAVVAA